MYINSLVIISACVLSSAEGMVRSTIYFEAVISLMTLFNCCLMLTDIPVSRGRCSSDVSMGDFLELGYFVCVWHFFFCPFLSSCVSYCCLASSLGQTVVKLLPLL